MTSDLLAQQSFGRYRLRYRLARGGMASVYLAQAQGPAGFEKWVAIKAIHPHLTDDDRFLRMFLDEARLSARLSHPNICSVFDFGEVDGTYFIAMEYLDGESLRSVINRGASGGAMPVELVVRIVADAARGLHSAHEAVGEDGRPLGVVHRDVSPHNIFVLNEGVAKVVDFGIARARDRLSETTSGEVKGKMAYMAPEQLDTMTVDRRSDVFALGVVLWEATTVKRLFKRESTAMTVAAVLRDPVPLPSLVRHGYPAALEPVVLRALQRDPHDRFQTMAEMADALEEFVLSTRAAAGPAQIASWMKTAFADRIAQRASMLCGTQSPDDEVVDVDLSTNSTVIAGRSPSASSLAAGTRKRNSFLVVAVVIAFAALAGLGGWLLGNRGQAPTPPGATVAARSLEPTRTDRESPPPPAAVHEAVAVADPEETADGGESALDAGRGDAAPEPPTEAGTTTRRAVGPAASGYLNLISVPVAEVWLGRRRLGTTPLNKARVPAGSHVLKLTAARGAGTKRQRVTIRADETTYLSVRLEP
jgi:serine/threonine-protein kinase